MRGVALHPHLGQATIRLTPHVPLGGGIGSTSIGEVHPTDSPSPNTHAAGKFPRGTQEKSMLRRNLRSLALALELNHDGGIDWFVDVYLDAIVADDDVSL